MNDRKPLHGAKLYFEVVTLSGSVAFRLRRANLSFRMGNINMTPTPSIEHQMTDKRER